MSYFYTKLPIQQSPNTTYAFGSDLFLKPSGRTEYPDYPGKGAIMYFDTAFFISRSQTEEEHIEKLEKWIIFHAFFFDFAHLVFFFEEGLLTEHHAVDTLENVPTPTSNEFESNFEDVAKKIYFFSKPDFKISYRDLFELYMSLPEIEKNLIKMSLFPVTTRTSYQLPYQLFHGSRTHWQIANYVSILEEIFGHDEECPEVITECQICGKKHITHRKGSERIWRRTYLQQIGMGEPNITDYLQVIEAAFTKVRHPIAHGKPIKTPHYKPFAGRETYSITTTIGEFQTDNFALMNLEFMVKGVTRELLLERLWELKPSFLRPLDDTQE